MSLIDNVRLIRRIIHLVPNQYTLKNIINLFIQSGANPDWLDDSESPSTKEQTVQNWIDAIKKHASTQQATNIIKTLVQMMIDDGLNETDALFLEEMIGIQKTTAASSTIIIPTDIEQLLSIISKGLSVAMQPLRQQNRRSNAPFLLFDNEYDVQSLLHVLLSPWVKDIRPEEYTPRYAGTNTRIDFLLPAYNIVCEVKYVRDKNHGRKIGDELIIDIAHYRQHKNCKLLWIVIYDPNRYIPNPDGLASDLETQSESIKVKTFVVN